MYECVICHGVNHSARLHCSTCGTIPKQYSVLNEPTKAVQRDTLDMLTDDVLTVNYLITVHVAYGCERQEHYRTARHNFRTVPADYYAEE